MKSRLTILPARDGYDPAEGIPKYGIEHDAQYFDLQSLVRMYGKSEVKRYLQTIREQNKGT